MSDLDPNQEQGVLVRVLDLMRRLAQSFWLGSALGVIALIFVWLQWRTIDFGRLSSIPRGVQLAAGAAYAAGLIALAAAVKARTKRIEVLSAGLSAHLLKYVPGSVWQGQKLLATTGHRGLGQYALTVLCAAGVALALSGRMVAVMVGCGVVFGALALGAKTLGASGAMRIGGVAALIVTGVAMSGALLGSGLALPPWWAAREVAGAWGAGVLVVPVPAGLGIRELFFSLSGSPEAAASLGVAHRVISFVVDVLSGILGLVGASFAARTSTSQDEVG